MLACGGMHPDAGASRHAEGRDAKGGGRANHGLFELAHIPADIAADFGKMQDGIADNLSRAMIGDIAAAVAGMEFDAHLPQPIAGNAQVFELAAAAEREHVGMLAQQQDVGHGSRLARGHQPLLQREGFGVADPAQVDHPADLALRSHIAYACGRKPAV